MRFGSSGFREANFYDAVGETLDWLKDVEGKKSIVVIGTGINFSRFTWDHVRKIAREHRTTMFAIGMTWLPQRALDRAEARGVRTGSARGNLFLAKAQTSPASKRSSPRKKGRASSVTGCRPFSFSSRRSR